MSQKARMLFTAVVNGERASTNRPIAAPVAVSVSTFTGVIGASLGITSANISRARPMAAPYAQRGTRS